MDKDVKHLSRKNRSAKRNCERNCGAASAKKEGSSLGNCRKVLSLTAKGEKFPQKIAKFCYSIGNFVK